MSKRRILRYLAALVLVAGAVLLLTFIWLPCRVVRWLGES